MSEDVKPYEAAPRASPTPDELRDLIRELGMTQRAAARSLDVDDRTLRYWASGQIQVPRMAILALQYLVRQELDRVNRLVDLQTQGEPEKRIVDIVGKLDGQNGEPTLAQALVMAATGAAPLPAPIKPCKWSAVDGHPIAATLAHAAVLYESWEMDNDAWAVRLHDGRRVLVLTSHGWPYIAELDELREHIARTRASLEGLERLERIRMNMEP